jgi:hypothetical protein
MKDLTRRNLFKSPPIWKCPQRTVEGGGGGRGGGGGDTPIAIEDGKLDGANISFSYAGVVLPERETGIIRGKA